MDGLQQSGINGRCAPTGRLGTNEIQARCGSIFRAERGPLIGSDSIQEGIIKEKDMNDRLIFPLVQPFFRSRQDLFPSTFTPHAGAHVHQKAMVHPLIAIQFHLLVIGKVRTCESHGQKYQGKAAQQEKEDVLQPTLASEPGRRRLQEHQRAERDLFSGDPSDQVKDDGAQNGCCAQQKERRKETHDPLTCG